MHAIEFPVEIDQNQQIHLQLPKNVHAHKARGIVMYEDLPLSSRPMTLGLFKGGITMSDDFNEPLADSFWVDDKS